MKELQIIVAGQTASGKSTMALLLEQFLMEKGFTVELQMENEILDYGSESRFRRIITETIAQREEMLMKEAKIVIKQTQLPRQPIARHGNEE